MLMMAVAVHVLMGVFPGFVGMFMAIMGVGHGMVFMLVLMFILVMATHPDSPPFL